MPDKDTRDELFIEDLSNPQEIFFECGSGGSMVVPPSVKLKAPPKGSPNAGRLVLATVDAGSIQANIDKKNHVVTITTASGGNDKQLLIRIPIGVRVFRVRAAKGTVL